MHWRLSAIIAAEVICADSHFTERRRANLPADREPGEIPRGVGNTAGTYVSDSGSPLARRERLKILTERADALLAEARQMDISTEEVIRLLRQRDEAMQPRPSERTLHD